MLKFLVLLNFVFNTYWLCYAQPVSVNLHLGPIVRLPISSLYDNPSLPISTYKNLTGLGVNIGLNVKIEKINIGLEYDISSRYDYLYSEYSKTGHSGLMPEVQKLLFEHNITILKYFDKIYIGIGASLLNTGQSFYYEERKIDMETLTYHFSVGSPIWKIFCEGKLKYIGQSYDPIPYGKFFLFEGRLYIPIRMVK